MSAIHSGPPVLSPSDDPDRFVSRLPQPLVVAFCVAGALFVGGLACGAMYLIRTRF